MFFRFCILPKTCLGDIFQEVHNSGDFDPEGLLIARDIKIRYGEKAVLWNYKAELYEKYVSDIVLDESRHTKKGIENPGAATPGFSLSSDMEMSSLLFA